MQVSAIKHHLQAVRTIAVLDAYRTANQVESRLKIIILYLDIAIGIENHLGIYPGTAVRILKVMIKLDHQHVPHGLIIDRGQRITRIKIIPQPGNHIIRSRGSRNLDITKRIQTGRGPKSNHAVGTNIVISIIVSIITEGESDGEGTYKIIVGKTGNQGTSGRNIDPLKYRAARFVTVDPLVAEDIRTAGTFGLGGTRPPVCLILGNINIVFRTDVGTIHRGTADVVTQYVLIG